jgi:hypothetical protein
VSITTTLPSVDAPRAIASAIRSVLPNYES